MMKKPQDQNWNPESKNACSHNSSSTKKEVEDEEEEEIFVTTTQRTYLAGRWLREGEVDTRLNGQLHIITIDAWLSSML
jgi:hypothetical protein